MVLKILITHKNPLPYRAKWIKKMILFNFTIHYLFEVKISYADFTFRIKIFLLKNGINNYINILKKQKLSKYLQSKWAQIPFIKLFDIQIIKKQKFNPIVFSCKVEYIKKKKLIISTFVNNVEFITKGIIIGI